MQVKFSVTVAIIIVKLVLCMYKQATVKTGLQLYSLGGNDQLSM